MFSWRRDEREIRKNPHGHRKITESLQVVNRILGKVIKIIHPAICRTIRVEAKIWMFENRFQLVCRFIAVAMDQKGAEI
jgi:hypothetical protein